MLIVGLPVLAMTSEAMAQTAGQPDAAAAPATLPPPSATVPAPAPTTVPPAPPPAPPERSAKEALYFEAFGPAFGYSLDYDHTVGDWAGRIGVELAPFHTWLLAVPLTISFLGIGTKTHIVELGGGMAIWNAPLNQGSFGPTIVPTLIVGYRFQPPNGGFFFRAGLSPIFYPFAASNSGGGSRTSWELIPWWPHIGVGATF